MNFDEAVELYEKTYLEMENDHKVQNARKAIKLWEDRLDKYRGPYEKRLAMYEDTIEDHVLDKKESVKQGHVHAVYYKPRKNVSWKSVALEFDPPQEIIDENTSHSPARVRIKWNMNGE